MNSVSQNTPGNAQQVLASGAPSHDQLVMTLRDIVEHAQVSSADLDVAIQEVRSFLPAQSQQELHARIAQGDVVAIRLAALGGLSAATLLRMSTSQPVPEGLRWEDWLRAILEAVGMPQIEEEALRQLAFDVLVCALSDLDESAEDEEGSAPMTNEAGGEDGGATAAGIELPTLSLPHFRALQQHGRAFLQLH